MIEDLRAVEIIVRRLTNSYIACMLDFLREATVANRTKLKAAIDGQMTT